MVCQTVSYYQFRNLEQVRIALDPSVNIFLGNNAQGKTNALEGMYLMAQGRSFRPGKEKDMIAFSSDMGGVKLCYREKTGEHTLEFRMTKGGRRQCKKDGVPIGRMSEFIGNFRAVIFCPEHLSLVKDGPSIRRQFCDMALSQLSPVYLRNLQEYAKILSQRNAMLKSCREITPAFREGIAVWSEQLAERAEYIGAKRCEYLCKLQEHVQAVFADMTLMVETPSFLYAEGKTKEEYNHLLNDNLEREVRAQTTLYGTHRDDYEIRLNAKEARLFASQGQQRSLSLAMKIAEGEISREIGGEYPVFLLDDIFSELDQARQDYIMQGMKGRQIVITSCHENKKTQGCVFYVENGSFRPA